MEIRVELQGCRLTLLLYRLAPAHSLLYSLLFDYFGLPYCSVLHIIFPPCWLAQLRQA